MRIGFHLTPFWSPTDRAPTAIIDEAIEVVRAAAGMGFAWVSIGHHWLSHPTVWPHPIAMLGRLAPEAGAMRLKTSMLLLPLLNPVDVAESVVTGVRGGSRGLDRQRTRLKSSHVRSTYADFSLPNKS